MATPQYRPKLVDGRYRPRRFPHAPVANRNNWAHLSDGSHIGGIQVGSRYDFNAVGGGPNGSGSETSSSGEDKPVTKPVTRKGRFAALLYKLVGEDERTASLFGRAVEDKSDLDSVIGELIGKN